MGTVDVGDEQLHLGVGPHGADVLGMLERAVCVSELEAGQGSCDVRPVPSTTSPARARPHGARLPRARTRPLQDVEHVMWYGSLPQ
jgi:hypothetical protein